MVEKKVALVIKNLSVSEADAIMEFLQELRVRQRRVPREMRC